MHTQKESYRYKSREFGMKDEIFWFPFYDDKLLLLTGKTGVNTLICSPSPPLPVAGARHAVGMHDSIPCVAYSVETLPERGWSLMDLRGSFTVIGESLHALAGKGAELIYWDKYSRWCPACGVPTRSSTEISKRCPQCGREMFPQIATAVLVLVRKEETTLLVRAHNFKGPFYGLVAGFLEVGETLEECAAREVREETGLTVGNIAYFGSQPWPYPSGLMVGFISDWLEGELRINADELSDAGFYTCNGLPELPSTFSLTRRMIDWWSGTASSGDWGRSPG